MEVMKEFSNKEAMQKRQLSTVLIDGIELPTYQKHYKDLENLNKKIHFLRISDLIQSAAILVIAIVLLLK